MNRFQRMFFISQLAVCAAEAGETAVGPELDASLTFMSSFQRFVDRYPTGEIPFRAFVAFLHEADRYRQLMGLFHIPSLIEFD